MRQQSTRASIGGPASACFLAATLAATPALADFTCRFTGAVVDSRGGTRIIDEHYDRSDAGGQGAVSFHEFPPLSEVSRHMSAVSSAGRTYLSASAHASCVKDFSGGGFFVEVLSGSALAQFFFDDVVFSGPAGVISVSVNVHLSGTYLVNASPNNTADSILQLSFYRNDTNVGGGYDDYSVTSGGFSHTFSGPMTGFTGNGVVTSQSFTVQANTPVKIGIGFSVSAGVSGNFDTTWSAAANTDFSTTLTLATDRPVFNVPGGYTVNSAQAGIVNNTFSLPCPADFNHDGQVDDADFSIFVVGYDILDCADPAMAPGCPADLNQDNVVDDADFSQFVVAYDELICP